MSDTAPHPVLDAFDIEHTIVPYPQRSLWAVVNRRGDIILTGGYADCLRALGRLSRRSA
jgi:hypothetical protein